MSPAPPALVCLGLYVIRVIQAQSSECLPSSDSRPPSSAGPLPKPSLRALPSSLVPLEKSVTLKCQGPPAVDLYRLEKLRSKKYEDQDFLFIPTMQRDHAGCYRCSYQNGSRWSPPSKHLELIATGDFTKPSLSAYPSPAVPPGGDVTLQCQSQHGFDQFALYKEGDDGSYQRAERLYRANFSFTTVTAAHSGTYKCYSFSSSNPYLWSAPSDPLVLTVTGVPVTPRQVPTEASSFTAKFPEVSRRPFISVIKQASTTEISRNVSVSPGVSSSPFGFAHQHYTKGNLVRICLGVVILIFLAGLLAEDWHSRKKPLPQRVRAVQRLLPPLPLIQK